MIFLFLFLITNVNSSASNWNSTLFVPSEIEKVLQIEEPKDKAIIKPTIPMAKIDFKEKLKPNAATNRFQQKALIFSNLYGYSDSPYRGAISKTLRCQDKEAQPKKEVQKSKLEEVVRYRFFTNDYFALGVCDKADRKYSQILIQIYCVKSNSFAEISIYDVPGSSLIELATQIRCK